MGFLLSYLVSSLATLLLQPTDDTMSKSRVGTETKGTTPGDVKVALVSCHVYCHTVHIGDSPSYTLPSIFLREFLGPSLPRIV